MQCPACAPLDRTVHTACSILIICHSWSLRVLRDDRCNKECLFAMMSRARWSGTKERSTAVLAFDSPSIARVMTALVKQHFSVPADEAPARAGMSGYTQILGSGGGRCDTLPLGYLAEIDDAICTCACDDVVFWAESHRCREASVSWQWRETKTGGKKERDDSAVWSSLHFHSAQLPKSEAELESQFLTWQLVGHSMLFNVVDCHASIGAADCHSRSITVPCCLA